MYQVNPLILTEGPNGALKRQSNRFVNASKRQLAKKRLAVKKAQDDLNDFVMGRKLGMYDRIARFGRP